MAVLTATELHQGYGDRVILDSVSLSIQEGEHVGLVGINGSGKSTLSRILAGTVVPDSGRVTVQRGATVGYLPQEPRFAGAPTAREVVASGLTAWRAACEEHQRISHALEHGGGNVAALVAAQSAAAGSIEALGGWDQMHRVENITGHLGIERLDDSVANMSGGERRRVDLARILVAQPALAILDEPTNHLDVETIEWLEEFLVNEFTGALLLITHDRYVLSTVVTRTLEIENGAIFSYDGGWESYLIKKEEREAMAARTEANRQNLLRREIDWLRRSPQARTTKQKARIGRAEALIDARPVAAEKIVSDLSFSAVRSGKTAFEMSKLGVSIGGKILIDDLSLIVQDGERIGIVGPNGAGKTSLLRVLLGQLEPTTGQLKLSKNTRFAYFDQERVHLEDDKTVLENVGDNREMVNALGREMSVHGYLSGLLFSTDKQRQKVASLSGGERARVVLAKFLLEEANVLLLDEPTNDLDVATLSALEDMLQQTAATVIVVTHDRYFLDRVANAILCFEGDGRVVRYEGSYQAFREQRLASKKLAEPEKKPVVDGKKVVAKKAGLSFTERHELENMMPHIEEAEAKVAALEGQLADPALYAERGAEVPALMAELKAAQTQLDQRLARWEELESKRSAE